MCLGIGGNTWWLVIHHVLSIGLVLAIEDYVFGSVFFTTEPSTHASVQARIGSMAALVLAIVVCITGIVPDIGFGDPAVFNHTTANDYGTIVLKVTGDSLGSFSGPLLFDIMEHVSLIVPGLIAVVTVLCWSLGKDIFLVQHFKRAVLTLTLLAFDWIAVIAVIGVYIVKFLTFPVGN